MEEFTVINGDVTDIAPCLGPFDAVLCDPPYGLGEPITGHALRDVLEAWLAGEKAGVTGGGFMGKRWDSVVDPSTWAAVRAALKPGAFAIAFGGTRTFDLQCVAQRLAGFELKDEVVALTWMYGTGFPKSHDVSRAIATPDAERFDGYGTALKPAHEPIGVWRNPTHSTYAENALERNCGALNIDGTRVPTDEPLQTTRSVSFGDTGPTYGGGDGNFVRWESDVGRWPTNAVVIHHPACTDAGCHPRCHTAHIDAQSPDGSGSDFYPRFAYESKPSKIEREAGLFGEARSVDGSWGLPRCTKCGHQQFNTATVCTCTEPNFEVAQNVRKRKNIHPTVKPIALAQWLATLLLPPGGEDKRRLLVPFCGSGSEMIGGLLAGFDLVVGIEQDPDYCEIARTRLAWWAEHRERAPEVYRSEVERRERAERAGQVDLCDLVDTPDADRS